MYLAIVAIWAFVLIPRWLRRPQALPEQVSEYSREYSDEDGYGGDGADAGAGSGAYAESYGRNPGDPVPGTYADAGSIAYAGAGGYGAGSSDAYANPDVAPVTRGAAQPLSRSRVLQARRRLLTMLVLLTVAAVACTGLKLTSWWACIPPAGMLGMYLLLLRETALADAEQARRRAATELRVQAARQRAQTAWEEAAEEHSAEIIDISARVGDQLYDQYNDATIRAVGD